MLYKIGDVSKLLGLSSETLRLYERSGIISSVRNDKTGYRYYGNLDITALIRSRTYRNYGFSVKDTVDLINESDHHVLTEIYTNHEEELKKEIIWKNRVLKYLNSVRLVMENFDEKMYNCEITKSPGMYRFEYMYEHELVLSKQEFPLFNHWIDLLPLTFLSLSHPLESLIGNGNVTANALGIMEEDADKYEIKPNKFISYHPPQKCVYTIVTEGGQNFDSEKCFRHVFEFMEANYLKPIGDSYGRTFLSLNKKQNYTRYRQVWLPVE